MSEAVIAAYVRSPFTLAHKGALATTRPDELAAQTIRGLIKKTGIDPKTIEDLMVGCAFPEGEQGLNVARLIGFLSELPITVAAQTVNRFCGSSMQTIHNAVANIKCGIGDAYIVAGVESMSRVPMTGFNPLPHPGLYERYPEAYEGMGITAENLAKKYKIKRKTQEEFACDSHQKAADAQAKGNFVEEIIPIETEAGIVDVDGCIRPGTSVKKLSELAPAFDAKGSVTAGTSSPLTDGASAVLVCSRDYADAHRLKPLASVKTFAVSGCAPEIMGIGPVSATEKILERAKIAIEDIDIFELNEAFAAQSLAVIEELEIPVKRLNVDGGAIAMGHPLGASGARITGKAASLLQREQGRYALAAMCIGGGQGIATLLERVE